ncbi:MAG: cysteine dioxygenase family protein [Deltaproteobacteria bacterium]|nr:cysteine dioxygenase family protein [Deltaproteobacteria bacterium]
MDGAVNDVLLAELAEQARQVVRCPLPLTTALGQLPATGWVDAARFDPQHPYGRRTLWHADGVEVMIAGWSPGRPCAPHDHGAALGAVRVLQGRAVHRQWHRLAGRLVPGRSEVYGTAEVLACPRGYVHQMCGSHGPSPLVTLHLYVGPTSPMAVYDRAHTRTQWIDAGGGAWVHASDDARVLAVERGWMPSSLAIERGPSGV